MGIRGGIFNTALDIRVPQEVGNLFLAAELLISQKEQCSMEIF